MGFQFLHIEAYSRRAGKGKAGGHSVRTVVAEAAREPGACPHVVDPKQPRVMHGVEPAEVERIVEERAASAVDARGRKLRVDRAVLLAGVASFPETVEKCAADPEVMSRYRRWEDDTVAWLRDRYGDDQLLSVVRHVDEEHPHVHFYVAPRLRNDRQMRIEDVHDGRRATAELGDVPTGERNAAYKAAMRLYQDEYWERVGLPNGLTRLGPGRRRLSRADWKAEQASVQAVAFAAAEAAQVKAAAERAKAEADQAQAQAERLADQARREIREARTLKAKAAAALKRVGTVGGWVQGVINAMRGRDPDVAARAAAEETERRVRREEEARRQAAEEEARKASIREATVRASLHEVARERDALRARVEPSAGPKSSLGPRPR